MSHHGRSCCYCSCSDPVLVLSPYRTYFWMLLYKDVTAQVIFTANMCVRWHQHYISKGKLLHHWRHRCNVKHLRLLSQKKVNSSLTESERRLDPVRQLYSTEVWSRVSLVGSCTSPTTAVLVSPVTLCHNVFTFFSAKDVMFLLRTSFCSSCQCSERMESASPKHLSSTRCEWGGSGDAEAPWSLIDESQSQPENHKSTANNSANLTPAAAHVKRSHCTVANVICSKWEAESIYSS